MGELNFCLLKDILKEVVTQISTNIPMDKGLPFWLIRLLHNKINTFIFNFSRCYFLYFDLTQITNYVPFILLPFVFLSFIAKRYRKIKLMVLFLFPLIHILDPLKLNLGTRILMFQIFYMLAAFYGMYLFYKKIRTISHT